MSLLSLLSSHPDVVLKICALADAPRPAIDIDGYAGVRALSSTCLTVCLLSEYYAERCETDEEAVWKSLGLLGQGASLDEILYAVRKARPVVRRAARLKAEEQKKFDAAYPDLDAIEARLANAATEEGDPLVLSCCARARLVKIIKRGGGIWNIELLDDVPDLGDAGDLVDIKRNRIKKEYLLPSTHTINNSACGTVIGCGGFKGKVTSRSLLDHRRKVEKLEAGIEERCAVQITYDDFEKGLAAFKASCEAAPTETARLFLIAAKAEEARMLPRERLVTRNKSRLGPLVGAIAEVAGDGYAYTTCGSSVSGWADAIVAKAEAELAKRPVAERRAGLVTSRQWAFSEPKVEAKRDALYQQIKERAAAIDPANYPFTSMDAAARVAACEIERSLWSAPEGRPGRNTVASRRFQLPLRPDIDLGRLADALRDGLSFLIPTSAIEVFPLEHYVKKMEHGAKIYPHLYPLTRE